MASSADRIGKRQALPVIHVKGTNYEVGFDVGRSMASVIHSYLECSDTLNDVLLPKYHTKEGKEVYDQSLEAVRKEYPNYVKEIEGTADGAQVPFYKLYLLHIPEILMGTKKNSTGCTSIILNKQEEVLLGHNEDEEMCNVNHCYIIQATVTDPTTGEVQEDFTAYSYSGLLTGDSMGCNGYGLAMAMTNQHNVVTPMQATPRAFLMRALLGTKTPEEAHALVTDPRIQVSNGLGISLIYKKKDGSVVARNIEIAPNLKEGEPNYVDIKEVPKGEYTAHCNNYLRIKSNTEETSSSLHRHEAMKRLPPPNTQNNLLAILGDTSDPKYPLYRTAIPPDRAVTMATGLFNMEEETWSIYLSNPKTSEPFVILPMMFKF